MIQDATESAFRMDGTAMLLAVRLADAVARIMAQGSIDDDDIDGVLRDACGRTAGVWVIVERNAFDPGYR